MNTFFSGILLIPNKEFKLLDKIPSWLINPRNLFFTSDYSFLFYPI